MISISKLWEQAKSRALDNAHEDTCASSSVPAEYRKTSAEKISRETRYYFKMLLVEKIKSFSLRKCCFS